MKKIIKGLEKQLSELRGLISEREIYVDERSEKWQESDKCEEYLDKTAEIEEQADELENLICHIKEL